MFSRLRIQNFKGWEDTGAIDMAPISLFFGANSSGKSSIGQFLMMLKQTVESPDRKAVFHPGGKNSVVQLGSYQEMVFGRNTKNRIGFAYQWSLQKQLALEDPVFDQWFSGDKISFEAQLGLAGKNRLQPVLDHLKYNLIEENKANLSIGMKRKSKTKSEYDVDDEDGVLWRKQGRAWPPGAPVRFYGFPDEVVAYYQNADFVQALNLWHEKLFRSLFYLGPLRTRAERLYSWAGIEPSSVGYAGENTIAAILAARGRKIGLGYKRPAKPFEEIIALKLKEMGLVEAFEVKPISRHRQEYEVRVRARGSGDFVDLPDVGFGISQVLPVLVQCFHAPPGSIIIMEQPEIHLHPSAQSALADVLLDAINARENGADRNIQLIIETHSEHFLRRLQRRIADDTAPREKVSAYFADVTKTPARLEPLRLDEFGNIENWPERFFGDEMEDVTEQAKAAMKKRMRQGAAEWESV
uniref:Predicted ATPase n=1 Tax=Candidatus Kentrum sp. TC TaxID=2126339 RepID=A0A450ZMT3_9GAMM|nr:MAG: Predicted ATPase [Candidatus Kentron sp. TC]